MPLAVGSTTPPRAYLGSDEVQRIYHGEGLELQATAAGWPRITELTATPAHAALGAAVAGALEIDATAEPAGATLTCVRGDGTNVPASGAGNFVLPSVPNADERFTVTAENSLGEQVTRSVDFIRTTDPSWASWDWVRYRAGPSGGEYVSLYRLTATINCWPKPVISLEGDSFFQSGSLLGGIDLSSSRHLNRGTGTRDWNLVISQIRIGYTGTAIHQSLQLRATNPLTNAHADRSEAVNIGGSPG